MASAKWGYANSELRDLPVFEVRSKNDFIEAAPKILEYLDDVSGYQAVAIDFRNYLGYNQRFWEKTWNYHKQASLGKNSFERVLVEQEIQRDLFKQESEDNLLDRKSAFVFTDGLSYLQEMQDVFNDYIVAPKTQALTEVSYLKPDIEYHRKE